MRYLFIDTETGGLEPTESEVLQLAWILTDKNFVILEKDSTFLSMTMPANPKALAINGLTEQFLKENAGEPLETYRKFCGALLKADCIVGHHIVFDIGMLEADIPRRLAECESLTAEDICRTILQKLRTTPTIDTKTAYLDLNPAWKKRPHPGPYLDELCRFLGVKTTGMTFHRADTDAEATRLCLEAIKKIYCDSIRN